MTRAAPRLLSRLVAGLALLLLGAPAGAHPLGNFTVSRYAALDVEPHTIGVYYVVDMAEIPTFRELRLIDTNGDHTIDDAEEDAYLQKVVPEITRNLKLTFDGAPLTLSAGTPTLHEMPGTGGLTTLRLEIWLSTPIPRPTGAIAFKDTNYSGRPGWQEIVADGKEVQLSDSSVPTKDRSDALRAYPEDELASPPQVTEATFRIGAGAPATAKEGTAAGFRIGAGRFGDRMTALIATRAPLGPWLIVSSLFIAAMLGALHALSPGHGKTIVGAYLVGTRGTAKHAVFLGLVVTATHTLGVYLLGLVTLTASAWVMPERLFPWISIVSGLIVVAIGASLAASRLQIALAPAGHGHAHGGHHHHHHDDGHHHDHDHPHEHGHSHMPPPDAPIGWRSLLALGVSGGLLPCPSALVVMLGAIALGRVAFGLLLIVAFSVGLAGVLTGIGLVLVYARGFFDRLPLDGRFARYVPVASAVVISVAGLAIVAEALAQMGV